jgi:hypothetical protein
MQASPANTTPAATARSCHRVRWRNTTSDMAVASTMYALVSATTSAAESVRMASMTRASARVTLK